MQASIAPGRLDGASAPPLHRRPRLPGTVHGRVHRRCASWGPRRRVWKPRTWLISHPPPTASDASVPSSLHLDTQTCSLSWDPPRFNAEKLSVRYLDGSSGPTAGASSPAGTLRRRYTLTHNDLTGELALSVGREYNANQVTGWYVRTRRWCAQPRSSVRLYPDARCPSSSGTPACSETRSWPSGRAAACTCTSTSGAPPTGGLRPHSCAASSSAGRCPSSWTPCPLLSASSWPHSRRWRTRRCWCTSTGGATHKWSPGAASPASEAPA